jgi:pimeloyl-ACP methyl ester carboxylesterase
VGKAASWPTWIHAARHAADANAGIYPDYGLENWLAMAKRLYRLADNGRIVPDYDAKIAIPFKLPAGEADFDLWPTLDGLKGVPTLIVRGGVSDLFSAETAAEMIARLPAARLVTVPGVGHAPLLDEPEAVAGIDSLLAEIAT